MNRKTILDIIKRSRMRQDKRKAKRRLLGLGPTRTQARDQLWAVFSQFIRLRDKPNCKIGVACHGSGQVECCYHIVPKQRGDSVYYLEDNCVGACNRCNFGEYNNRSLYREHHIRIFGSQRIEALEMLATQVRKYSTVELIELRDKYRGTKGGA